MTLEMQHERQCKVKVHADPDRRHHDGPCQVLIDAPMTGLAVCFRDGWQDGNGDEQWVAHDTVSRTLRLSEYEVEQYRVKYA